MQTESFHIAELNIYFNHEPHESVRSRFYQRMYTDETGIFSTAIERKKREELPSGRIPLGGFPSSGLAPAIQHHIRTINGQTGRHDIG